MLDDIAVEFKLFDRSVVEFIQSAVESDLYVGGCRGFRSIVASKTVCKDALLGISAIDCALLKDEVCLAQNTFKVFLWFGVHEVASSNFLSLRCDAALFQTILSIRIVDCLARNCRKVILLS